MQRFRHNIKVCILTSVHPPFDVRIFLKEARSLCNSGYEVSLVVPCEQDAWIEKIKICAVERPRNRLERIVLTTWRIFKVALRQQAHVYHIHDAELIPVALILRLLRKKVIYDIHEDVPATILTKGWIPAFYRRFVAFLLGKVQMFGAKRFSGIVVTSMNIGDRFRLVNKNTVVVQNYPLLEEYRSDTSLGPKPGSTKIVVNFGGISRYRAICEIIEAFGLLPASLDVRLVLGGQSNSDILEEELTLMPGWGRVEYRGMIAREEMMTLLRRADVAIVVYSPAPNHLEVRSNRFFESLAAGIPVITSNFPKWTEIVEGYRCGLTVDPLNPQAIANAIVYILEHHEEAKAMGRRGVNAIEERYNWCNEEKKLLQLYEDLLR